MNNVRAKLEKLAESGVGMVDIHETAKLLGVKEGTLYQWRSKGINLRSYKSGGKIVYDLADLLAYLEQRESTPAA